MSAQTKRACRTKRTKQIGDKTWYEMRVFRDIQDEI